jgi:hypothetical protein
MRPNAGLRPGWRSTLPRFALPGFTLPIAIALSASAQDYTSPNVIVNQSPSQKSVLPCKVGTNFEIDKYRIAHVAIDDPFRFLYWIGGKSKDIEAQLSARLTNQLFTYRLVDADALAMIESARFAPDSRQSFSVRIEMVSVQNCDPAARTLDLVYRIYSTDPPQFLGGAAESQTTAEKSPQTTTGLTQAGNPFHFTPTGGYNRSDGAFGGGRILVTPTLGAFHWFDAFTAQGQGSYSMRSLSAALSGSANLRGWLRHAGWRLNYLNSSEPAGVTHLKNAALSGQADGETRPFWQGAVLARFGALLAGGNMQSGVPAGLLPPQTVANAGYGSLKGYLGLTSRTSHNVLSISYGLELGSVGPTARVDWRKHIGDVADEFWIPIGDHKPLDVESRFAAGGIQIPHSIPLAARFFGGDGGGGGGDGDQFFIPGDSWQIREEPVIRAIPSNRFYLTAQGAGADRFTSVNLTISYPVKSRPIMPRELSTNSEFDKLLRGQIVSAASADQNYYTWKDPNFVAALNQLAHLSKLLDALQTAANVAQAAHPGQLPDQFADCTVNIGTAAFYVQSALADKGVAQYGDLSALLPAPVGSDALQAVQDACIGEVNQQWNDPGIRDAAAAVDASGAAITKDFNAIDQKTAARKAANDIAFVKRTLNTLFKDLNIFSVGPVAVFDAASIGPAKGALGGNRIGPGGGIRLELASYVNFTLGYAWNVNRQPGEGPGALFFSIGVRDLFH